ncbi:Mss4-like protein [Exophiala viscosa]|uniref:Mss4-like protein n=1 Tax=Exophiala viscosa TaxID=2486360 RepID=UPI002191B509|nr:Mss4-like protein [Exophiala viscosa]
MPTGSCFCGNLKIEYSGEPAMTVLCHCADCRHISGGLYSYNVVVPSSEFKVTSGTPKEISKTADSGKSITSNFCPECGTTLFRYGDSFGGKDGMRIIKAGVLDDVSVVNSAKPTGELYSNERIQWVEPVQGADQTKGMGS